MGSEPGNRPAMNVPETRQQSSDFVAPGYAAYAQLVKMLLPSSGCLAIYAVDGDLAWCSDGFERPDFRALVDEFRGRDQALGANQGSVRQTSGGVSVLVARLADDSGEPLGYVVIEVGKAHSGAGNSMAASLTRPVFACLASQLALERPAPKPAAAPPPVDPRMSFLLGIGEIDLNASGAIGELLGRCVDHLDCLSAVFCIPDQDLTETAEKASLTDAATRAQLGSTRKHLLAWVQLNNRPMVVNRIDDAKAPYKILSCPVGGRDGSANGLLALFRSADSANFELDDVRLIEFLSRQAMALLHERQDALTGLMSRPAFERHLDEIFATGPKSRGGMLLYLDIDELKAINDAFGFAVGDEVILRTAQLIRRSLMPNEVACRLAGDRFVLHLPERDDDGAATLGVEIARSARDLGYTAGGRRVLIALRAGVAPAPRGQASGRHWIAAAERACQQARSRGAASSYNAGHDHGV